MAPRRERHAPVEVAGLTIEPGQKWLYAASHGLGAWRVKLRLRSL